RGHCGSFLESPPTAVGGLWVPTLVVRKHRPEPCAMPDSTFTLRSPMPASAAELYDWHARPGAFQRLTPPWDPTRVTGESGRFGTAGYRVTVRTTLLGPFKASLVGAFDGFE